MRDCADEVGWAICGRLSIAEVRQSSLTLGSTVPWAWALRC